MPTWPAKRKNPNWDSILGPLPSELFCAHVGGSCFHRDFVSLHREGSWSSHRSLQCLSLWYWGNVWLWCISLLEWSWLVLKLLFLDIEASLLTTISAETHIPFGRKNWKTVRGTYCLSKMRGEWNSVYKLDLHPYWSLSCGVDSKEHTLGNKELDRGVSWCTKTLQFETNQTKYLLKQ